jgi:hypothetical protein
MESELKSHCPERIRAPGTLGMKCGLWSPVKNKKELSMRKLLLPLAASALLLSSTAFAQTSDTKAPSTTGPAAQSGDNMS